MGDVVQGRAKRKSEALMGGRLGGERELGEVAPRVRPEGLGIPESRNSGIPKSRNPKGSG